MKRVIVSAPACLLLTAGVAFASVRFSAGPTIGTTFGGVSEQGELVCGGQAAVHVGNGFSLELAVLPFTDKPEEERCGVTVATDQDLLPIQLSLCYARPVIGDRLKAFVLGGMGYYPDVRSDVEIQGLGANGCLTRTGPLRARRGEAFGCQAGAGLEWFATRRLSVFLEYRYAVMEGDASIAGLAANTPEGQDAIDAFEKDFRDNNELGILRVGLNWAF